MHYPDSEDAQKELEKRVAAVHAQAALEALDKTALTREQKEQIIDSVKRDYKTARHGG